MADSNLDPRPVVHYLRGRIQKKFGIEVPLPQLQTGDGIGWAVTIPTEHGELTLSSGTQVDVLELLEEHLLKMAALRLWRADTWRRKDERGAGEDVRRAE